MNRADLLEAQAAAMSESELLASVRALARDLGYLTMHQLRSRGTEPGWPDLVCAGHGRVIIRELKTAKGALTRAQWAWVAALDAAGLDVAVWRPLDLLDGTVLACLRDPDPMTPTPARSTR